MATEWVPARVEKLIRERDGLKGQYEVARTRADEIKQQIDTLNDALRQELAAAPQGMD